MALWGAISSGLGSALSKAIGNAISSSKSSSGNKSNSSGTYHPDGSYTPAGSSSSPSLRDYLDSTGSGKSAGWSANEPDYVKIGDYSFKTGQIPGTTYNPNTFTHYVTDSDALKKAIGINDPYTPTQQGMPIDAYLDALRQVGNTGIDPDLIVDRVMSRMPAMPEPGPTLSYDEAQKRAQDQLNPLYGETLQNALKAVDQSNIRRGFFGQLPGAALSRSTAADIGAKKAQAIGQLSNQLVGQSESNAQSRQALAQQAWGTQTNALLQALQQGVSQSNLQQNQGMDMFKAILGVKALENDDRRLTNEEERNWLPWLLGGDRVV